MVGRINDEDIALVRERSRIDDVVSAYVQLRSAGGGSFKGLCPFHDEKSPSFQVTPARGLFYCFGCGEGGDVISFVQKINNLSFAEAVQYLADRAGIQLRISDDTGSYSSSGLRQQILSANQLAAEFYQEQSRKPEAKVFRDFIAGRGFSREHAEHFAMGYAPRQGRALHRYLSNQGLDDDLLIKAGLIRQNGGWDYFQGRIIWPIRDSAGSVLGFGARRVFDDDRMPAKYLNTPETAVYKKSHVLYGLDLARKQIGNKSQAVVVEGYTDVMACHIAGIDTAVASCGTAFGLEHARILQRLLIGTKDSKGEVIFTFDGDTAGQNAALKVFDLDQEFKPQTYVAIEPGGLDPCDLRIKKGDAAVRDLIGQRMPLYRFVMQNTVQKYDLDRVDARLEATREAAPLLKSIRDHELVDGFLRELSQLVGMDIEQVRKIVNKVNRQGGARPTKKNKASKAKEARAQEPQLISYPWPDANSRELAVERGCLKLMLQYPTTFDTAWDGIEIEDFTHPAYKALFSYILETGFGPNWTSIMANNIDDPTLKHLQIELLVEPVLRMPDEDYSTAYAARLKLLRMVSQLAAMRSKLQRINPVTHGDEHRALFADVLRLEIERKRLIQESFGAEF